MNNVIKSGEGFELSERAPHQEGEPANVGAAHNDGTRFVGTLFVALT